MRIRVVENTLPGLTKDLATVYAKVQVGLPRIVAKNANAGNKLAQRIAREKAGPHGKLYYKRLTAEARTPLSWEYGPEGTPKTDFVGVNGALGAYMDLAQSTDVIGPKFAKDVDSLIDRAFW